MDYDSTEPFYGIWCEAAWDYSEADTYKKIWESKGYSASVVCTADWSNLNPQKIYAVTVGKYTDQYTAEQYLGEIVSKYSDAYVKYSGNYIGEYEVASGTEDNYNTPFYGIWCAAFDNFDSAEKEAQLLCQKGLDGMVYQVSEWTDLNAAGEYVVTAGVYLNKSRAEAKLDMVRETVPDAYIEYSGAYQGNYPNTASQTNTLLDGYYGVGLKGLDSDYIFYRNYSFGACADCFPVGNIQRIAYDPNAPITVIDPDDYSADAEIFSVNREYLQQILSNEKYGRLFELEVKDGKVIRMDERYQP